MYHYLISDFFRKLKAALCINFYPSIIGFGCNNNTITAAVFERFASWHLYRRSQVWFPLRHGFLIPDKMLCYCLKVNSQFQKRKTNIAYDRCSQYDLKFFPKSPKSDISPEDWKIHIILLQSMPSYTNMSRDNCEVSSTSWVRSLCLDNWNRH